MSRLRIAYAFIVLYALPAFPQTTDELAAIGRLLIEGHAAEARTQLGPLRERYAAHKDERGEAGACLLLALTAISAGEGREARLHLAEAEAHYTAVEDHFGAWMALWLLAEVQSWDGHFDDAAATHERARVLLAKAGEPEALFTIDSLKMVSILFGAPPGLLDRVGFPSVLKTFFLDFAGSVEDAASAHILIETGGDLREAEQLLQQATAISRLFGGFNDFTIEAHMGELRQLQWRLEEAREHYVTAITGSKRVQTMLRGGPVLELKIYGKLAELELLRGQIDEALAWNDRALSAVRAAGDTKREAGVLQARGSILQKSGRYAAALRHYDESMQIAAAISDLDRQASLHADLGALHMFKGTYGNALRHLETAIGLYQTLDQPLLESTTWMILAEVHSLLNVSDSEAISKARTLAKKSRYKLAEVTAELIAAVSPAARGTGRREDALAALLAWRNLSDTRTLMIGDTPDLLHELLQVGSGKRPTVLANLGEKVPQFGRWMGPMLRGIVEVERGEYEAARQSLNAALALDPGADLRAGMLGLLGATHWLQSRRDEGIRYFKDAAKTLDAAAMDVKVEELLTSYLGSNRRIYFEFLVDMLAKEGRSDEAFAQAERSRARAFLQLIGNHRLNAEHGADPRLVREAEMLRTDIIEREQKLKDTPPQDRVRLSEELQLERARYASVVTRVKTSNPEYAALTIVEPLEIGAVQAEIPPDVTMISYFISTHGVHAWVIDRTDTHHKVLPVDRAGVQRLVCWVDGFGSRQNARGIALPGRCGHAATAEEAFDALVAPIAKAIRNRKLVIVPHGVLHYVPFAALRDSTTRRDLVDDYTVTYAPSASTLRFLREKESPVDGTALILGNPASPLPGLPALPGAAVEAGAIAKVLGAKPHIGAEARESLIHALQGKVDVVHLAAHGLFDSDNPLFSRIVLAAGDAHDGSLTVDEILSSTDLTGVNLVVLSACSTAVGNRSGGDEIVGLTRALLYAGTPGVLSTLWNIDDAAAASVMDEFYRRLASGASAAEALRQAQLAMKQSKTFADPKYWAAFSLHGDPQGRWPGPQ